MLRRFCCRCTAPIEPIQRAPAMATVHTRPRHAIAAGSTRPVMEETKADLCDDCGQALLVWLKTPPRAEAVEMMSEILAAPVPAASSAPPLPAGNGILVNGQPLVGETQPDGSVVFTFTVGQRGVGIRTAPSASPYTASRLDVNGVEMTEP